MRYKKQQRSHSKPNRSGGIVYRTTDGVVEYLLVRPKRAGTAEWVFPKGHIDENESHAEAAAREVREEAGVIAQPMCSTGRITFKKNKERVDTEFYLMKATGTCEPAEHREIGWFKFDQALQQLTHSESKRVLQLADQKRMVAAPESTQSGI